MTPLRLEKSDTAAFYATYRRFYDYVDTDVDGDGCWEWQRARLADGYGKFSVGGEWVLAHRAAWEMNVGPIPDGLFIMHLCDNPPCVRVSHLRPGTNAENMRDALDKGLLPVSNPENAPSAKLTWELVEDIRRAYADGVSQADLGRRYGVWISNINHIVHQRTWPSERRLMYAVGVLPRRHEGTSR